LAGSSHSGKAREEPETASNIWAAIQLHIHAAPRTVPRGTIPSARTIATFFPSTASYEGTFAGKLNQAKLAPQGEKWLEQG
jgi:hypothetical protein